MRRRSLRSSGHVDGSPRGLQGINLRFSSFSERSFLLQSILKIYRGVTIRNQMPSGNSFSKLLLGLIAVVAGIAPADAGDRSQARSMVIAREGIVAAEHPLASQIGATILAQGGNAVDAAVAANAAMGVVAPMANGIGGDLFAIVYEAKSGKLHGLNASGWSPAGLGIDVLRRQGHEKMPQLGIHAVTVPGCVDGWQKLLDRFGRKRMGAVLTPAIQLADEGFPVTEIFSDYWVASEKKLRADTNATRVFLPAGRAPKPGELFRNPDLAWALSQIARRGPKALYAGEIARRILQCSDGLGGTMRAEDLAKFSAEWVAPISTTYRGWTVYELPPNGQGIAALAMLNVMENFPLAQFGAGSADALHIMIEAKKLAYADMLRFVADPHFARTPVAGILSKDYAKQRAALIEMGKANCSVPHGQPPPMGTDTTYLCVVDSEGNMVSLIQSIYHSFGSGVVPAGTGFPLHNRGGLFSLDPAHPNALAGRKRPLHTIIPAFMTKGELRIAFGIMGGWNQSQAHAQFVANVVDHGMNLQAALEAPRFTKQTFEGCDLEVESRVSSTVREALAGRGHKLELRGEFASAVGGGQAVMRDFAAGINYGASDPRKDGCAIPQPRPRTR